MIDEVRRALSPVGCCTSATCITPPRGDSRSCSPGSRVSTCGPWPSAPWTATPQAEFSCSSARARRH